MTEEQKRPPHSIVERALEMASKGIDPIEFDNYAVEQLQDMLKEYFGKQDLVQAVEELIKLAYFLDVKKGCHSASMKIITVVNSATEGLKFQKKYQIFFMKVLLY
ncbi:MAG: hypothetical protein ACTSPN_07650 [Promethearchaeota archaeon]